MPPKPNPDAVKDLGLEEIADEQKRKEVTDFFQARTDLLSEIVSDKKKPKEVLQEKMKEYNRTQVQTQQIIDGIIQELQKDSLERDLNEGFNDAGGQAHDSYIEQFHKEVDRVGVDLEGDDKDRNNPVRLACLAEVVKAIRAIPTNLKRSYRHEYVKDMIADYVKQMDKKAEWMKIGTLHLEELKDLKMKAVQEWAKEPGRPPESELMQKYNPDQAKEFIQGAAKTKDNLTKISQQSAALAPELKQYFDKGSKDIEGFMAENPSGAAEAAQKLADEAAAVTGIIALKGEISTKISETTDEAMKKRYTDLSAKIDTNLKAMPNENDPTKRKAMIDLPALQGEKSGIDANAGAPPASGDQTPPAEENPEPDFTKDPKGWLKYQFTEFKKYIDEILGFFTGIAGFFGVKSLAGAAKTAGGKTGAEKIEPAKLEAASKFLKDKFKVSDAEFKKLAELKLGDFLKLSSKPDWMDAGRFDSLKKAFSANKTTSDSDDTLLPEFIAARKDDWIEPVPVAGSKGAPVKPATTPSRTSATPAKPAMPVQGATKPPAK